MDTVNHFRDGLRLPRQHSNIDINNTSVIISENRLRSNGGSILSSYCIRNVELKKPRRRPRLSFAITFETLKRRVSRSMSGSRRQGQATLSNKRPVPFRSSRPAGFAPPGDLLFWLARKNVIRNSPTQPGTPSVRTARFLDFIKFIVYTLQHEKSPDSLCSSAFRKNPEPTGPC